MPNITLSDGGDGSGSLIPFNAGTIDLIIIIIVILTVISITIIIAFIVFNDTTIAAYGWDMSQLWVI